MFKSNDNIGINPLSRISPVLSALSVGDPFQPVDARGAQFSKSQQPQSSNPILLQNAITDTLKASVTSASFSPAAHLIDEVLKEAQLTGLATKFEAKGVITRTPQAPALLAHDLKMAIEKTGLFYESHLAEYADGRRTLADVRQEPQNMAQSAANSLLPQQLNILENQRLSWHAEVWPNQKMDWDMVLRDGKDSKTPHGSTAATEEKSITSDLTLHLPHLGKVTAKLSLIDGRMRVAMHAKEDSTLATLKAQSHNLQAAIEKNGQRLEGLLVTSYD